MCKSLLALLASLSLLTMSFNFVNTSVTSEWNRALLPFQVYEECHTIFNFFRASVKPRMDISNCELLSAQVGDEKDSLDNVDATLRIVAVLNFFWHYHAFEPSVQVERVILLQTVQERNKKDKLYNYPCRFSLCWFFRIRDERCWKLCYMPSFGIIMCW